MGPIPLTIILTIIALVVIYVFGGKSRGRNYPRGPYPFPLFGNWMFMRKSPYKTLTEWAKTYGTIMAVDFGSFPAVVITDAKLIRAALDHPVFQGRPDFQMYKDRSGGGGIHGVMFTEGRKWSEQRRFLLRTLGGPGFGEGVMHEEVQAFIGSFENVAGRPVSTANRFNVAILNILWAIITGERFKYEDPDLKAAVKYLSKNVQNSNALSVQVPALNKISTKFSGYDNLLADIFPIVNFLKKPIDFHKATFQDGQPRDFIDAYMEEIIGTNDSESSFYNDQGEKSLLFNMVDLFMGGIETTSKTLAWAFLYLAKFQKVQKKLFAEIQNIVGMSRLPALADVPRMPFTGAFINETLRYSCVTPLGIPHKTTKGVIFERFTIPKETLIIPNLYGVHFDEETWGDPDNFRPQRFLNRHGELKNNENFVSFSTGKRCCLGEGFARDELFVFITGLVQAFQISPATSSEELSIEPMQGNSRVPLPHKLVFQNRNN